MKTARPAISQALAAILSLLLVGCGGDPFKSPDYSGYFNDLNRIKDSPFSSTHIRDNTALLGTVNYHGGFIGKYRIEYDDIRDAKGKAQIQIDLDRLRDNRNIGPEGQLLLTELQYMKSFGDSWRNFGDRDIREPLSLYNFRNGFVEFDTTSGIHIDGYFRGSNHEHVTGAISVYRGNHDGLSGEFYGTRK